MATRATERRNPPTISMQRHASASPDAKTDKLALALARGMTRVNAAKEAGMGLRTVYTRLADPEFRQLVADHRNRLLDEASGLLADSVADAISELRKLAKDERAEIRLRASVALLDQSLGVRKHVEMSERMTEIEKQLSEGRLSDG